ncbi:NUDIX domain-containing protein [Streptomyces sp. H10-C2]|uniref:NUDIX hydrolase n=1 Tax=unclassified Streptomyces TaxID=2593676 RepID=UPI0024BBEA4F|nr:MULTISPECIES: NUDIX domain-containing protein [unclassified Streptomyces]MDJ0345034.1 NUDIX domain-containing protein [Streptomyces sp. PH10-H1]MDJ0370811.1 NUDIX domain-containing protein [Streptomyces sp. H10-C2]
MTLETTIVGISVTAHTTAHADGQLNLPSGKVDAGEDVISGMIREAREEVGITLQPQEIQPVHVMHMRNPEGEARVGWFFAAKHWQGEPVNAEPHKCAGLSWHRPDQLPAHTVPYNAYGIARYFKGEPFSIHGW